MLDSTRSQISSIHIDLKQPLIISDADEVLLVFMAHFERFLCKKGYYFDWSSFKLTGNVHRLSDKHTLVQEEVFNLLKMFFDQETRNLKEVPGASQALKHLSLRAQIVVLTNIGAEYHSNRKHCLAGHGMDYPLVANRGEKGPAVHELAKGVLAPVFFLDDSPNNIKSVAKNAEFVRRIHFVHDKRLSRLVEQAPESHHRLDNWIQAEAAIEAELTKAGY
jgi:hypothetical protein